MQDTREKLLKIAARLFADKGFAGASVRDIVHRAGANISAIRYHFGDKRGLYRAVIGYLLDDLNRTVFSGPDGLSPTEDVHALTPAQALQRLRELMERFLDMGFSRRDRLLERILLREKIDNSGRDPQQAFFEHAQRSDRFLCRLVARVTGLNENGEDVLFLTTALFGQIPLFNVHRFVILRALGVKEYTPAMRDKIKAQVWHNTKTVLDSYRKGKDK